MNRSQEYILCAAVWYKDFPLEKDNIPSNLVRPINCDSGIVFSGYRHPQCIYQQVSITGKRQSEAGEEIQGFLTSKNRFVDRIEGLELALKCKQIDKPKYGKKLYSEDLY